MLLRCENLELPMSQLGHSRQTNAVNGVVGCPLL
jgi:hypothetical protein